MKKWIALCLVLCLTSCSCVAPKAGAIRHVVLVWLKPEFKGNYVAELQAASRALGEIPGVIRVSVGTAIASERPIVDSSFDLGVLFEFETLEALTTYTTHPKHTEFLKTYVAGKAEKVVIYDF